MEEIKTYETIEGIHLALDDLVWVAALDMDSFNYVPVQYTVRRCIKGGQTAFWQSEENCINECVNANSL